MCPQKTHKGFFFLTHSRIDSLPKLLPPALSTCPLGGLWVIKIDFSGQPSNIKNASCSLRSKDQSHGVSGTPAPKPQKSNPFNDYEPIDSSAAAIGAQGLLRLGNYLNRKGLEDGNIYVSAGLTVAHSLLSEPYLSPDPNHQGLLLHTIYHRPNGWDHIPKGSKIPNGEACMWGDYHLRELAYYLKGLINGDYYYTFFKDIVSE